MNPRRIVMAVLALAVLFGWLVAPPGQTTGTQADDSYLDLPAPADSISNAEVEQALSSLYRRKAWSAAAPESDKEQQAKADQKQKTKEKPPESQVPEGLDRFTLVGIIRVQGQPAEALLIDAQAQANNELGSVRAREGESLQDGEGIRLATIDGLRVQLRQADESRWLELFRRIEAGE